MKLVLKLLPLLVFPAMFAAACGDDDDAASAPDAGAGDATAPDAARSDAGAGADVVFVPVGSGSVTGPDGFGVATAKWADAGPFQNRQRVMLTLADDEACRRPRACTDYRQLTIRFTGPEDGGAVAPGTYSVILSDAGPLAGKLEVRLGYQRTQSNGCQAGDQPAERGVVTVEAITDAQLKGSFDLDILAADGGDGHLTGAFDAVVCP